jgi:hypothetical protein
VVEVSPFTNESLALQGGEEVSLLCKYFILNEF